VPLVLNTSFNDSEPIVCSPEASTLSTRSGVVSKPRRSRPGTSDLYQRYVKKLDQQESELENLRKEIEGLKDNEAKQQRDLNDYLLNLEVE
jgi:hypothetical protein